MDFVQGTPLNVYVGQTTIDYLPALNASCQELTGFNLALHVNDCPQRVYQHRIALLTKLAEYDVQRMTWVNQTHSTLCHTINEEIHFNALDGDGLITRLSGHALMIMTADCLPIVIGNIEGTEVANLHAGWRGLANGIIENTIQSMQTPAHWAWFGAAISQSNFEVGVDVKNNFCCRDEALGAFFEPSIHLNKYYADLYKIAEHILKKAGVKIILGGGECSYRQSDQYYSYRRNAKTGRMATFVFMQSDPHS